MLKDIIRELLEKNNLTTNDFAKRLGVTSVYVAQLLKGVSRGKQVLPSTRMIDHIAKTFSKNEDDYEKLKKRLMIEKTKAIAPDEIKNLFDDTSKEELILKSQGMPKRFVLRLKKDIARIGGQVPKLDSADISKKELDAVLNEEHILSRAQIISLAELLHQPVEEYLVLSDYMPDHIKKIMMSTKRRPWTKIMFKQKRGVYCKNLEQYHFQ